MRELNERRVPWTLGSRWTPEVVKRILSHPKYTGSLVCNRTEKKLHNRARPTSSADWIVIANAFEGIVDPKLQAAAKVRLASFPRHKSDEQMIDDVRRLLRQKDSLSLTLMRQTHLRKALGMSCPTTHFKRFGSLGCIYRLAGFEPSMVCKFRARTVAQRKRLMQDLLNHFPDDLTTVKGRDKYLLFRNSTKVVTRICRSSTIKNGERRWTLGGCDGVSLVLAALMNAHNTEVETLFLLPPIPGGRYWFGAGNPLLGNGTLLNRLVDFAGATRKLLDDTLRGPMQVKS